jgi:hypothetical protein
MGELVTDFVREAEVQLSSLLSESGKVLYSAASTLKQGDIYVLGFNPGGDPAHSDSRSIGESLYGLPSKMSNDYFDESWARPTGKPFRPGSHPLQRNLRVLFDSLGRNLQSVCASNLIFVRSKKAAEVQYLEYAGRCWSVHELILDIVKPRTILAFGNSTWSTFSYLYEKLGQGVTQAEPFPSGHGNWVLKAFQGRYKGAPVSVIGLPHLSRYTVKRRAEVVQWLQRFIAA